MMAANRDHAEQLAASTFTGTMGDLSELHDESELGFANE